MAHIFLQDDPKISVGDANDAPATIPTPEQLGSLLITYSATGATDQFAAAYAALEVGATAQWVPIAATGATGATGAIGPTGATGTAAVDLEGTISNDVASGVGDPIGTRPLASTLADGSTFTATDTLYSGIVVTHPLGGKIWVTANSSPSRLDFVTTSGVAVLASRFGVYNPATRVFTPATVSGQFCNARAVGAQPTPGNVFSCDLGPGRLLILGGASALTFGQEIMTDATGQAIPYVNNGTNIPLGVATSNAGAASSQTFLLYDY